MSLLLPTASVDKPRCMFCSKTSAEVRHMIAAPQHRGYICNDCVKVCVELIRRREPVIPPLSKMLRG
jgi:ATP-dependent protease Clp ATPase subunit